MMRDFLEREARPFETNAETLDGLHAPPEEGFLTAMLSADSSKPPPQLLQIASLTL